MASIFYKAIVSLVLAVGVAFGTTTMPAEDQSRHKIEATEIKSPQALIKEIWKKDAEAGLVYAKCESGFRNIQSLVTDKNGSRENSWGIFQINLDAHPKITKEQALDAEFNIRWAYEKYKAAQTKKEWRICYDIISNF